MDIREEFVRRAVSVLNAPQGFVAQKIAFLKSKGVSDEEVTVALNRASGGAVVASLFD